MNKTGAIRKTVDRESLEVPEFLPGSIRRIRLQNFMTYNDLEFFPGPRLNLVLGPNGSGKSAIVSALVLGLGGKPSTLGRAEDLKSYIKHERGSAFIEIEIENRKKNRKNIVVKRILNQNSSIWQINGINVPKTKIDEVAAEYSIQVSNMTQFLPQEKVSHFGTLKPPEILRMTEYVYGGEQMLHVHDSLLGYQKELARLQATQDERKSQLETLGSRIQRLETLLSAHKQLENLRNQVDVAQMKKPILYWREATAKLLGLQDSLRDVTERMSTFQHNVVTPLQEQRTDLSTQIGENRRVAGEINKQLNTMMASISTREQDQRRLVFAITKVSDTMRNLQSQYQSQLHEIERQREECSEMKEELERQQSPERIQAQIAALKTEISEISNKENEAQTEFTRWQLKADDIKDQIERLHHKLKSLESTDNIMELKIRHLCDPGDSFDRQGNLARVLPMVLKIHNFVTQNQNKFHSKVYAPLGAYLTPKKSSGTVLDNFLSSNLYFTIVCTDPKDMQTLATSKNFSVHLVQNLDPDLAAIQTAIDRGESAPLESDLPKLGNRIPKDVLRQYGMLGFVDDLYDAPPIIKMALRNMAQLHKIPVAQPGKLTDYSMASKCMHKANIQRLAQLDGGAWSKSSFKSATSFGFEEYKTQNGPFTRIFNMLSGNKKFTTSSVTDQEIVQVKQEIQTLTESLKVPASKAAIIKSQTLTELRSERKQKSHLVSKLQVSITHYEKHLASYTQAMSQLAQIEKEITSSSLDEKKQKLVERQNVLISKLCDHRVQYIKGLTNLTKSIKLSHQALARKHQLDHVKQILDDKFVAAQELYRQLRGQKGDIINNMKQLSSRITKIESTIRKNHMFLMCVERSETDDDVTSFSMDPYHLADWVPPKSQLLSIWNTLPSTSLDLLPTIVSLQSRVSELDDSEFFDLRTRLEEARTQFSNTSVIQAKDTKTLVSLSKKTKSTAREWTSKLEELIGIIRKYIRNAFRSMKCVGDVKLVNNENDDYSSYGIDIFVSFFH